MQHFIQGKPYNVHNIINTVHREPLQHSLQPYAALYPLKIRQANGDSPAGVPHMHERAGMGGTWQAPSGGAAPRPG